MTYELLIQHQGTIMLPPVVENVSIEWERQGQPGKLIAEVVKTPGLSFQEGDPCRFSVDGTPVFYGFVFEKSRKGSTDDIIQITVYDQLYYLKNKDTYVYTNKTAADVIRMIAEDFQLTPSGAGWRTTRPSLTSSRRLWTKPSRPPPRCMCSMTMWAS